MSIDRARRAGAPLPRLSTFAIIAIIAIISAASLAARRILAAAEEPAARLPVLVVTGGHGYDEKEFDEMFQADGGIAHRHESHPRALETLTTGAAKEFAAIVLYDMYQPITPEQQKAYAALIRGGTGLVVLHHAIADFQGWPEYERMVGGKFFLAARTQDGETKPPSGYQHGVDIPVEIADPDHFITRGLESFTIHDETYNRFAVDPAVHVLLRTKHELSGPVIGWTKPYGKGRVVYLQLGHDKHAYGHPAYRSLVARSIRWAARRAPEDLAMRPIFNGRDLSGWKAEGDARFAVEDGILVGRQGPGGSAGDIFTEEEFGDFEMEATWAMDWPGNSGVWFRYQSGAKAYQADILEYSSPRCWAGSLYCGGKMFIAMNEDPEIVRREGWNTFVIRAQGERIQVHLNGRKVADVKDDSSARGRFGLQVHAGADFAKMAIRLADLRIRPLP
ncbi:MAG: DUF1080 domain-containing protein [Planctomycetes bacterium]|nr:DUF1080 domain-containing protein [Planctomycetota bacterium]